MTIKKNYSTISHRFLLLEQLGIDELWLDFGVGKHRKYIASHLVAQAIGRRKSKCLPFFHALTGCDTTSSFLGHGKRSAWETWVSFPEVSESFEQLCKAPERPSTACLSSIERFIILLYDGTSTCKLGVVGSGDGVVYLTSPGRPTEIGLQLGKACYPCNR